MNKILVIEDQKVQASLITFSLESQGYEAITVESGEEALVVLEDHDIALITLDINLNGMNGLQFLSLIKASEEHKNIPIIIISGLKQKSNINKAKELGANAYVLKPIVFTKFISIVKACLQ